MGIQAHFAVIGQDQQIRMAVRIDVAQRRQGARAADGEGGVKAAVRPSKRPSPPRMRKPVDSPPMTSSALPSALTSANARRGRLLPPPISAVVDGGRQRGTFLEVRDDRGTAVLEHSNLANSAFAIGHEQVQIAVACLVAQRGEEIRWRKERTAENRAPRRVERPAGFAQRWVGEGQWIGDEKTSRNAVGQDLADAGKGAEVDDRNRRALATYATGTGRVNYMRTGPKVKLCRQAPPVSVNVRTCPE